MIRGLLNIVAYVVRFTLRVIKMAFKSVASFIIVALLVLNLTMTIVPALYNAVSGLVWGTVSLVSESYAARSATRATTQNADGANARRMSELESERTRLRTERADLDSRLRSVETELEATRRREVAATRTVNTLRSENTNLVQKANIADADLERVAARNARMQRDAGQTLNRMQQRSIRMVTRNTAVVFTDALPFVGMVTIVGGVAWDLWDTCAQLGDLRSLGDTFQVGMDAPTEAESRWCGLSRDEIVGLILGSASSEEKACTEARLRTGTLDPKECAAFPLSEMDFRDPIYDQRQVQPELPAMNFD